GAASHVINVPSKASTFSANFSAVLPSTVRVEAESLTLSNYTAESNASASGGQDVSLPVAQGSPQTGTATGTFTGLSGLYIVHAGFIDDSDGVSTLSLTLGSQSVGSWQIDDHTPGSSTATPMTRRIGVVQLTTGDAIVLGGMSSEGGARWDYI